MSKNETNAQSLMKVYREYSPGRPHAMGICPAAMTGCKNPERWRDEFGNNTVVMVDFIEGEAGVTQEIGKLMLASSLAQKTPQPSLGFDATPAINSLAAATRYAGL